MISKVVAVALSGGVDSLVSGFLVKKNFSQVFGIHFTTGYEAREVNIKALEAQLDFPIHQINLTALFEKQVVTYFISTYLSGKTPNPCLICNQQIKFGALLDAARKLGADILATGHYATVVNALSFPGREISHPWLERGTDPLKDQSYFLSLLGPGQLEKIFFPLAGLTKTRVKEMAKENRLFPLSPSESQDICFIHDKKFSQFIMDKTGMEFKPGPIKDLSGKLLGSHEGLYPFTIGQRRGINCPGPEPYYVHSLDLSTNTLRVCFKRELGQDQMQVTDIVWNGPLPRQALQVFVKIRYSHKGAPARLVPEGSAARVIFETPQLAITPGQAAVFYQENRILGAGIIQ